MKKISLLLIAPLAALLFSGCAGESTEAEQVATADSTMAAEEAESVSQVDELTQFKYDKLIGNVPIPFDILKVHTSVPLSYSDQAVNNTANLSKYVSNSSKAINLGVYGADLAYSITYEKFDAMGAYLKCAKKLADDLGIPIAFDQQALADYKKYETNKDSLEQIIFNSYTEVDKTLKTNERIGLASLVVAGGWIEGLHGTLISLGNAAKDEKTSGLYQKIWEQKNHLDMIIGLLEQFKEDPSCVKLLADCNAIKAVYAGLQDPSTISQSEMSALTTAVGQARKRIVSE